ncbi:MAG: DUF502 domain-containing protein [bacterium]|nr:DUF502 domain-containing protein [bacterium]
MKRRFVTGIIALLPIGVTVFIVWFLVTRIGGILEAAFKKIPLLSTLPSIVISFIGFLAFLALIYIIGTIASGYIGRRVFKFGEEIVSKVPIIRVIYTSARKFTNAIFVDRAAFKKVVLVEYPRKGLYTLAFMTNESSWRINEKEDNVSVFIPTAPNPTSGYYAIVPRSEIRETSLSVDSAMRVIISGGIILPDEREAKKI